MKKAIYLILLSVIIISCKTEISKISINKTDEKKVITSLLNNWHKAAAKANYNNYFGALDSVSIYIGTDVAEVWSKKQFSAFSKPYFNRGKAWAFTAVDRNVYFNKSGDTAWFDEILNTWMGVCRGSGVLEKTGEDWKIKHYVLSITVPNDNINDVIKINKEKDSIFLSKYKN